MASSASNYSQTPYLSYLVTDPQTIEEKLDQFSEFNSVLDKVKGYALPEKPTCIDKIKYIAYRIWNAFKAIFDMSDWQQARRGMIKLGLKYGMNKETAEEKTDLKLNDLLKNDPHKEFRNWKITLNFLDIVLKASQAKDQVEMQALCNDPTVLSFMRGKAFNDLVADADEREFLSRNLFGDSRGMSITHAMQALPLRV